jgi:LacI family transcriptional regulator
MEPRERQRRKTAVGATIRDVAVLAGVSPMTVSRVINGEENVKPETRELVSTAIRELNYAPNHAARSLAGWAPSRIGLLYDNPSTGFLSEFLVGVLDESSRTGSQVVLERCLEGESAITALNKLLQNGLDGVILLPPLCESEEILAATKAAGLVAIAVAPGLPSDSLATLRIDNRAAAFELTQHLLDLGHRRFGFIKGHPNQTVSALRHQGFLAALAEAGVDPDTVGVEQAYFTYRSGLDAAEKLLARSPRPTAIFAGNDDMGAATLTVAHRLGLATPEDISVVGFDDTPIANTVWPALTTVRQPIAAMAQTAVDLVLEEIRRRRRADGEPRQAVHPHMLVIRESTAPPPGEA